MKAIIEFFLKRLIRKGRLELIGTDGSVTDVCGTEPGPYVTVRLHDNALLFKLSQDFSLHFGEAYMDGRVTIERGQLYDLMSLLAMNIIDAPITPWAALVDFFAPIERFITKQNSIAASRRNVAHHYGLAADFYKLFLDHDLQYSCGYFIHPENDLDTAQLDKKRLIASKLLLKKGMRVLDIGCGYGGLAIYLAQNYGVQVTGITLSTEQIRVAIERAKESGVADLVQFEIKDYRHETGSYDRIVSVGMFEHVGLEHYKEFFGQIKSLLNDDGVALLHTIGRIDAPDTTDTWIDKYIFPGGYAPSLSEVMPILEKSRLWTTDIEFLRLHYAKTLTCWRANFNQHRDTAKNMYDERFCRMWEFYLVAAELFFRYERLAVFQIQLAKDIHAVPLTRDYMVQEMQRLQQIPEVGVANVAATNSGVVAPSYAPSLAPTR